jgi:ribosomal protein S12 methylthiotransferase accessory factor YcaO
VLAWTPLELVDRSYNLYSPSVTYPWVDTTELSSTETEAICGDWKFTLQMSPSLSSLDVRAFAST